MSPLPESLSISVVVPTYKAADTIDRALDSILTQTFQPLEVIVVDDASGDETVATIEARSDPLVRCVALTKNAGPSAARNAGLAEAQGDLVAFLDADDWWLPEKLAKQRARFVERPEVVLCSCDSMYFTPEGDTKRRSHEVLPPVTGSEAWKTLLAYNYMPTPTVMARRELMLEVGAFDPKLDFGEDLDLWIRVALRGEVEVVPEVLVHIVEWSGSLTGLIRHRQPEFVIPYVTRYIEENQERMNPGEAEHIMGKRNFEAGNVLFYAGKPLGSLPYFWRAALAGERPARSLSFFARAAVSLLTLGKYPGGKH